MWGIINSLQVIAVIPMLNVVMPANAKLIYEIVYKLANFENPVVKSM